MVESGTFEQSKDCVAPMERKKKQTAENLSKKATRIPMPGEEKAEMSQKKKTYLFLGILVTMIVLCKILIIGV